MFRWPRSLSDASTLMHSVDTLGQISVQHGTLTQSIKQQVKQLGFYFSPALKQIILEAAEDYTRKRNSQSTVPSENTRTESSDPLYISARPAMVSPSQNAGSDAAA